MRTSPVLRLTIGILSITVSLLFISLSLGLIPNEQEYALRARSRMAELLAIQLAAQVSRNDPSVIKETINAVVERGHEVISAGIRKPDGEIVVASENHESAWKNAYNEGSAAARVSIPLMNENVVEGNIELLFTALPSEGTFLGLSRKTIDFIFFMFGAGLFGYYTVLRRSLKELDPGSAFPERVTSAFDCLAAGVIIIDINGLILLANKEFAKIAGQPESLVGSRAEKLSWALSGDCINRPEYAWQAALRTRRPVLGIYMSLLKPSGVAAKLVVNATPILDGKGDLCGVMVTFDDVTVLHQKNELLNQSNAELRTSQARIVEQNEQLRVLASTDSLTGCLNRRTFIVEAEAALSHARTTQSPISFMMLDVDHFKAVNDRFGHSSGDAVLSGMGAILRQAFEPYGLVGRYGGEEFCVALVGLTSEQVLEFAEYVRQSIAVVETWLPEQNKVTVSIGHAAVADYNSRVAELLKKADEALYLAKHQGRNQIVDWGSVRSTVALAV